MFSSKCDSPKHNAEQKKPDTSTDIPISIKLKASYNLSTVLIGQSVSGGVEAGRHHEGHIWGS